ncbi:hypothetical protein DAH55_11200 [Sphingomonas koreensis]|nr:hypothetical protein DAH56_12585 [Sphingomonas koreensis]RSU68223.1 hypothetical protein DAH55_11200 [Sphingomonas koreensis]
MAGTGAVLSFGLAAIASPAFSQSVATDPVVELPAQCSFSKPAQAKTSLRDAPDIADEFRRVGLVIADVGEPYVPFDVVDSAKNLPHRQFLRAYAFADRTIAWYYHGGSIVTHVHVVELRPQRDRRDEPPVLRMTARGLIGPPCEATEALLSGVSSASDW